MIELLVILSILVGGLLAIYWVAKPSYDRRVENRADEVVAELRALSESKAADIVESMFGLKRCGEGCDGNCELTAYGPTKAEAARDKLRAKAVEVVAELEAEVADLARHNWNEYIRDRSEALNDAAKLVAQKLLRD